ncbi:MAG TPA: Smr/MutS family protein [Blastocatellia bacterium]|nr:Smr/MutS family protein [Blastocatellia bacterium]
MGLRDWIKRAFGSADDSRDFPDDPEDDLDPYNPFPEPVVIEFTDVLDLHHIPPKQVKAVVEEFLTHAQAKQYRYVRIIHGKGISVQRKIVRSILSEKPFVAKYSDAPPEAGGWGATVAELRFPPEA